MNQKDQTWYTIKWRNLASLFLALSGIIISISGIVLFIAPPGRFAHAVDWHILGLDKGQWEAAHTMFSFVAVIFAIIHVVINWKSLVNYLWKRTKQAYRLKRELTISIALILIIGIGTILAWPPFSTLMDWGEALSDAWESGYSTGVDEQDSLLVDETDLADVDDFVIETEGGWGRYTIADICAQQNVTVEDALTRLALYDIDADEEARIRTLADSTGYEPSEIVDIILGWLLGTIEDGE